MKGIKDNKNIGNVTAILNCCFWLNLNCSVLPKKTQEPDAGVKACYLRETEKAHSWPSSTIISEVTSSLFCLLKQKTSNWISLPSTSCESLYPSSLLPPILFSFFLFTSCQMVYGSTSWPIVDFFNPVYSKQKALGLKACARAGSHHNWKQ